MTPAEFIAKWKPAELKERAACQEHFLDLCKLLKQKTPAEADSKGDKYTFEYGVQKDTGGQGFADVWKKDCFGWEYKGKRKNLIDAYRQLSQYREALGNPPLLVVCDLNRFEIHTNFTGTEKEVHTFDLDGLADPKNVETLRRCFADPEQLKPGRTQKQMTEEVAGKFAFVATAMQKRGIEPHEAGHFLMKCMFCMFAEDIGLLPENLFLKTLKASRYEPKKLSKHLADLFDAMANRNGTYGADEIAYFNGGLFKDAEIVDLEPKEIRYLEEAAERNWSSVEPSIFGTLFERILNPSKRSQLGAHYTSKEDILTLLKPVMEAPLRREWETVKAKVEALWAGMPSVKAKKQVAKILRDFHERLAHTKVLDPACGSGNFLYVALNLLLDLEKEVRVYATTRGLHLLNLVSPGQLHGIELNPYAQELAQVVIWIGYLQWIKFNGDPFDKSPVLDSMENIENRDAILDMKTDPANPKEPQWPEAEFIVGNPPFLGDKKMRGELGDAYVEALRKLYDGRLPGGSDLVCYWFEKARARIATSLESRLQPVLEGNRRPAKAGTPTKTADQQRSIRAGLIATQGIRGGANRSILNSIKSSGDIFFAVADRDWVLDGANVHISMIAFDDGSQREKILNTQQVSVINPDLTSAADITTAQKLPESQMIGFVGTTKKAPLDLDAKEAIQMLVHPNPHGRTNSDVLLPYLNAENVTKRVQQNWIIDFGSAMNESEASLYELPFEHVNRTVKPLRVNHREPVQRSYWWRLARPCPDLFKIVFNLPRYLVTPIVAKHRLFAWECVPTHPDHALVVFARHDDYFFRVMQSHIHEKWALAQGTQVRERESGFRYTPTTCFETYPFPEPTDSQREDIATSAKELDTLRNNWLNPPEWMRTEILEFPGSVDGPWKRYVTNPNLVGIGTVKYPRLVPKDVSAAVQLKNRTLTQLYNQRPTWLANAHKKLDEGVFAAYGWSSSMSDDELLAKLLELNLARAAKQ